MHKLFGKRGFAVFTSLALCVSLVSPSFAATFMDLQYAVRADLEGRNEFTTTEGETRYGYGSAIGENKYEIEVWETKDDENNSIRNVILNEDVTAAKPEGGAYKAVVLHSQDGKVELDLNGHSVTGKMADEAALVVRGGDLTLKDSSEAQTGKVTGGKHAGVWVEHEEVTPGMTQAEIEKAMGTHGSFTLAGGTITGNNSYGDDKTGTSNGVGVTKGSTFIMTGGAIKGNNGNGPAVLVDKGATFTMTGGLIESNATGSKDGVEVRGDNSSFKMSGGSILLAGGTDKTVQGDFGKVTITGGTFSNLDEGYVAEGYVLVDNGNDTWSVREPEAPAAPTTTYTPAEAEVEIDEPAVPLAAGPVTRGEFIDYLWRHEGEPESEPATFTDVPADHEYAPAIGWAQSIGIISGDIFDPDELVTVGAVRDILANFAAYSDMTMPILTTLTGDEDEAVLNCDEVLAEFFGEELTE